MGNYIQDFSSFVGEQSEQHRNELDKSEDWHLVTKHPKTRTVIATSYASEDDSETDSENAQETGYVIEYSGDDFMKASKAYSNAVKNRGQQD